MTLDPEYDVVLDACADFYEAEGRAPSYAELAAASGMAEARLRYTFRKPDDALAQYFALLPARCTDAVEEIAPPTFEETVAAFSFILLDLLEARPRLLTSEFDRTAAGLASPFRIALGKALGRLLDGPGVPAVNGAVLAWAPIEFVTVQTFVQILEAWIADESAGRERAVALIEKAARFYAEIGSNQSASRGIDLVKYAYGAGFLPSIPFLDDWLNGSQDSADDDTPDGERSQSGHTPTDSTPDA